MAAVYDQEKLDLQKDYPEILIKFFKVLKELKLDFNVGVFITGVESLFDMNRLDNFVYLLRSASLYFPNFLKIVVTLDNHPRKKQKTAKILQILQSQNVIEINNEETFRNEGKSYMEFALLFGTGVAADQHKKIEFSEEEKKEEDDGRPVTASQNLDLSLKKCSKSYRKCI